MTWTQNATAVTLSCNGSHQLHVVQQLCTDLAANESHLGATQRIWQVASEAGWTATSTHHSCPSCTRRAQPANPTAP